MTVDATRAHNPLQKVQGYIELGGAPVTTTEQSPRLINVQELLPGKHVRLLFPGTDVPAPMYDALGNRITPPVTADDNAFYSFYAETGQYDISFSEPSAISPTEIFRLTNVKVGSLIFNVRDFGAKGNGEDDDTLAIQVALNAMIAAHTTVNGVGTLFFPNGKYMVSRQQDPYIFDLPSGIIIQGTAGPYTGSDLSNCEIVLTSELTSIFRIRTDRHKIIIRDIGMTTTVGNDVGTIAIDARAHENLDTTYSSNIEFNNLTIWNFERGISIEGSGEVFQWDVTGVRVNHCHIGECRTGIYINSQNCDFMKITDSRVGTVTDGFGIYLERVGIISIDSVLGAAPVTTNPEVRANTFIYITAAHGTVTISGCECEGYNNSIQVTPISVGNFSWPILLLNCSFGPTIQLSSQCEIVSIASKYLPETLQCDPNIEAMIYSFGDCMVDAEKHASPYMIST